MLQTKSNFLSSSVVEQWTVNPFDVGSSPTWGVEKVFYLGNIS